MPSRKPKDASQIERKGDIFVVSPIGSEEDGTRAEPDEVLYGLIKPAAALANFAEKNVKRADEFNSTGKITNQVIRAIYNSQIVIADLTGLNPNVIYELALAYAFLKPVILIAKSGELRDLPFDIREERVITYEITLRNDSKRQEIADMINDCLSNPEGYLTDNPVTSAISTNYVPPKTPDMSFPRDENMSDDPALRLIVNMFSEVTTKLDNLNTSNENAIASRLDVPHEELVNDAFQLSKALGIQLSMLETLLSQFRVEFPNKKAKHFQLYNKVKIFLSRMNVKCDSSDIDEFIRLYKAGFVARGV